MQRLGAKKLRGKGLNSRFRGTAECMGCVCGSWNDVNGKWRTLSSAAYLKVHASRIRDHEA